MSFQTSLLPSVTTSPKMPSVSGTGHTGGMRTAPSHASSYPSLSSAPPTPVPESAPAPPVAPAPPSSLPRPSPTATWNPTAVGSPAPPERAPKPAEPPALRPPRTPAKPGAQPLALGVGAAAPRALPPPKLSRRGRSIVPAKPRPPPPLFVTGEGPALPWCCSSGIQLANDNTFPMAFNKQELKATV